ncbi:MAG TPA: hypothetical protein DEB70_03820 [Planctomycetaceae bacterium]|nr:hypothetical protein [Planctomycetaceae bacterium]
MAREPLSYHRLLNFFVLLLYFIARQINLPKPAVVMVSIARRYLDRGVDHFVETYQKQSALPCATRIHTHYNLEKEGGNGTSGFND